MEAVVLEDADVRGRRERRMDAARRPRHRFDRLQGLSEGIERGQSRVTHELLAVKSMPAPTTVADELELAVGAPTLLVERRSYVDGDPIALGTHWLPAWVAAQIER